MNLTGNYEPLAAFVLTWAAKATAVLTLAWIASFALRHRSAAARHRVWAIAIIGSLMLPLVSFAIPAWHLIAAPLVTPIAVWQTTIVTNTAVLAPTPVQQTQNFDIGILIDAALLLWALGVVFIALRIVAGMARLWRISAYCTRAPENACAALDELRTSFGIRRKIRLLESANAAMMPMTWGIVHPMIVLPAASGEWEHERRQIVLSHELAHIMRGDWLLQICAEMLRACFWFNPFAWIAASRLRQESERACDDAVLNSGIAAPEYASQLLALARSLKTPDWRFLLALAVARPSNLERRFSAMLDSSISRHPLSRKSSVFAILLAALLLLPLAALTLSAKPLPPIQPQPVIVSLGAAATNHSSLPNRLAQPTLAATPNAADEWPAGRGRAAFLATCSSCHVPQDVIGRNLDSRGWTDVINRMIHLGAQGSDEDFAAILDYLKTNFGPKPSRIATTNTEPHSVVPSAGSVNDSNREQGQTAVPGAFGSISGMVGDPSGALAPHAAITLTDVATGQQENATTGEVGEFTFSNLIPDSYELSVEQPGFKIYKQTIQLASSEQLKLPEILLTMGVIAQTVTVSTSRAAPPRTQTPSMSSVPVLPCPATPPQAAQPAYVNPVQPGPPPARVRVGGNVQMARIIQQTMPIYPESARAAGIQGTVVMNTIMGKDGTLLSTCVTSGAPSLAQAVLDAVSQWRYSPTLLDGQPVEAMTEISVVFTLTN